MGAARLFANDHVDAAGKAANLLRLTRQPRNNHGIGNQKLINSELESRGNVMSTPR
jgi:hypothetical protein